MYNKCKNNKYNKLSAKMTLALVYTTGAFGLICLPACAQQDAPGSYLQSTQNNLQQSGWMQPGQSQIPQQSYQQQPQQSYQQQSQQNYYPQQQSYMPQQNMQQPSLQQSGWMQPGQNQGYQQSPEPTGQIQPFSGSVSQSQQKIGRAHV